MLPDGFPTDPGIDEWPHYAVLLPGPHPRPVLAQIVDYLTVDDRPDTEFIGLGPDCAVHSGLADVASVMGVLQYVG